MSALADRLSEVHRRIDEACAKAGRHANSVELIIVTKNHPTQLVLDLLDLGESNFGENKDQEAANKAFEVAQANISSKPVWHFVGQLQSNKVRSMLTYTSVLHSLDRRSLLNELAKHLAKESSRKLQVFIELNLTSDPGRGGVSPDGLLAFAEEVMAFDQLEVLGVMGVAGLAAEPEAEFEKIAEASQKLQALRPEARYISAGMSGDFETAIAYGATHIRVGTAITGNR